MEKGNYKIVKTNNRYKKSVNEKNNVIVILLVVMASISTMVVLYQLFKGTALFENKSGIKAETVYHSDEGNIHGIATDENNKISLVAKQYGVFTKEGNALDFMNKLSSTCCYIIKDGDKIKVMGEIYAGSNIEKVLPQNNGTNFVKVNMSFPMENSYDNYTSVMIDAILQVANKFSMNDVKSVKTQDIKQWVDTLKYKANDEEKSFQRAEKIKKFIKSLPEEVANEHLKDVYKFVYDTIIIK